MKDSPDVYDPCPLCGRPMEPGPTIDRHHLVPRSRGGKETTHMHRVCHDKVHATFTEKQLQHEFSSAEALLQHEEIARFVAWVGKKDATFMTKHRDTAARRRKRKR